MVLMGFGGPGAPGTLHIHMYGGAKKGSPLSDGVSQVSDAVSALRRLSFLAVLGADAVNRAY